MKPKCIKCNYTFVTAVGDVCPQCKTIECPSCHKQMNRLIRDENYDGYICANCYQQVNYVDVCWHCGDITQLSEDTGMCSSCEEKFT